MIRNYIGLETLRFGDRLDIHLELNGQMNGLRIAPLILYSFVESCFVQGAGENPKESRIRIELKVNDSRIRFIAATTVSASQAYSPRASGETIQNTIRRLELAYPNSHRLAIRERNNEHEVELHISL